MPQKSDNDPSHLRRWNRVLIIALVLSLIILFFNLTRHESYNRPAGYAGDPYENSVDDPERDVEKTAICDEPKPNGGDSVRVKVSFTAPNIDVRGFIWNEVEYARSCFPTSEDAHNFDAYLPYFPNKANSFTARVKSSTNDNTVKYGIEIYNLKDSLLAKFPSDGKPGEYKIKFLKRAMILQDFITINP